MRIPRESRPAPYFNRRDQYRMLAMVGLLCLVMIAIKFAAQPSSWHWLLPPDEEAMPSTEAVRLDDLDFRVIEPAPDQLRPGEFRAVAAPDDAGEAADNGESTSAGNSQSQAPSAEISDDALIGIVDNTLGVRSAEAGAYHLMLERVRTLSDDDLAAQARDDVAFTVIMLQPEDYRGQLVRIAGQLRRLVEYPVMENSHGIGELYEGWVFTNDSGTNPWRFLCTQLPEEAVIGETPEPVMVEVTGYFFKRFGYASQGGQHVAPTLLARTFDVLPVPISVAPQIRSELGVWLFGFLGLVIAASALFVWRFVVSDRHDAESRVHALAAARLDADPADLEALQEMDVTDSSVLFADTGEAERANPD